MHLIFWRWCYHMLKNRFTPRFRHQESAHISVAIEVTNLPPTGVSKAFIFYWGLVKLLLSRFLKSGWFIHVGHFDGVIDFFTLRGRLFKILLGLFAISLLFRFQILGERISYGWSSLIIYIALNILFIHFWGVHRNERTIWLTIEGNAGNNEILVFCRLLLRSSNLLNNRSQNICVLFRGSKFALGEHYA